MSDSGTPSGQGLFRKPRPVRKGRLFLRLLLGMAAVATGAFIYVDWRAPLDPSAPPHVFTGLQYELMRVFPQRCPAALERAKDVVFIPAPKPIENGCGHPDGVRITRSQASYGGPVLLSCPAAVALIMWERNVLQPEAQHKYRSRVTDIQTFGTYSCRNIYHRSNSPRSQHATADAIDVAGFTLEGGQKISVLRDWTTSGPAGDFLRAVRDGACVFFGTVLSPDYNAAHADHFHLDAKLWMVCR